jgi:hypothetical protein
MPGAAFLLGKSESGDKRKCHPHHPRKLRNSGFHCFLLVLDFMPSM